MRGWVAPALACLLLAVGCGERPTFDPGDGCTLNSDCFEPYVCRLDRCRSECARARDCPLGSQCLADGDGVGACRLDDEATCAGDADCRLPLVCRAGACTNECSADRECTAGSLCLADEATGAAGCFDPATMGCVHPSECLSGFACHPDGRCRPECREDRDCRDGASCVLTDGPLGACEPP